jgi:hypothetical protein
MPNINIKKVIYHVRWRYLTLNNIVLVAALVIGANWAWGSIEMMQRTYTLQRSLDLKQREQRVAELETATLKYEQNYHQSNEYKELAVRQYLGLAEPGEKVLILPPNSPSVSEAEPAEPEVENKPPSNLRQWVNFLFGSNRRNLQK